MKGNPPTMPQMCGTCPFRDGSPYESLRPDLTISALTEGNRECHSTGTNAIGGRTGKSPRTCRGAREIQLRHFHTAGVLSAPTDECWAATLEQLRSRKVSKTKTMSIKAPSKPRKKTPAAKAPAAHPLPISNRFSPEDVSAQVLEGARSFAAAERGNIQRIADAMAAVTGEPISRQMVGRWLNGTAKPFLGTGLILMLVAKHLEGRALPPGAAGSLSIAITPFPGGD